MAREAVRENIESILLRRGVVAQEILSEASQEAHARGARLENYLIERKIVKRSDMVLVVSEYLNMPPMSLAHFSANTQLLGLLPRETMSRRLVLPIARAGRTLTVAVADPFDLVALDEIRTLTGLAIAPVVVSEDEIAAALGKSFAQTTQNLDMEELMRETEGDVEVVGEESAEDVQSIDEMLEKAEGAPVIRMVNMMLVEALRTGASDIHIEPMEKQVRLRYRIDGDLQERPGPPKNLQSAVTSRIKIMSDLDIAERRKPQDGRFNIKALGKEIDLRVSILPTVYGEKIVMRILDKTSLAGSLSALGLDEVSFNSLQYAVSQPHGIILVTGPTGSGKTTTLYSCLQELNKSDVNIITCEDPVEYQLRGINQVQINESVGLSFSTALRSILRQDPDIVLVGEIRDKETAQIAIKAALTGHLVMSTLHTNDAPGAVTRLVDMGVEPFMLGSSLVVAQAQRLFRKLCASCKKPAAISPTILQTNHIPADYFDGVKVFTAGGCPRCNAGYKGRGAIMEVLLVNEVIREAILQGKNTSALRQIARENGMISLKDAGLTRVRDGITSLEATLEVTGGD